VPKALSVEQLQRLARLGAHARLTELEEERRAILRAFPGLAAEASRRAKKARAAGTAAAEAVAATGLARRRVRRGTMSAEKRQAASERMRKFWAERRKAAEA
jgi:hypothetical protein